MSFVLTPSYGQFYKLDTNTIGFRARFQRNGTTIVCCNTDLQVGDTLSKQNVNYFVPQGFRHELPNFNPFPASSFHTDYIDLKIADNGIIFDLSSPSTIAFQMIDDVDADFSVSPPIVTNITRRTYLAQWIIDSDGFAPYIQTSATAGRVDNMNISLKFLTTEDNVYAGNIFFNKQGDNYVKTITPAVPSIILYEWHMIFN